MKKTKHGDYEMKVAFPVFSKYGMHIVFTEDLRDSHVSRFGDGGLADDMETDAMYVSSGAGHAHVFYKLRARAGVVAHEAWHAIWGMFNWAGVDRWDNETTAYHLGYLVDKITDFQIRAINKSKGVKS